MIFSLIIYQMSIDRRMYDTILEVSFDIERLLSLRVRTLFFHFHRSSYKDNSVSPYFIMFTDSNNNKHTMLYEEIINTFKYLPAYTIKNNITNDYGYVDISNRLYIVNKTNTIYKTLVEYFNSSNTAAINKDIIINIKFIITDAGYKIEEDAKYIYLSDIDLYISKCQQASIDDKHKNIIIPTDIIELDRYVCIGNYVLKDSNSTDCNQALMVECLECKYPLIFNYNQSMYVCHKCGHKHFI